MLLDLLVPTRAVGDDPRVRLRPPVAALGLAYAAAGFLAVWAPWRIAVAAGRTRATNPIDGFQPVSLALLLAVGALGGLAASRLSPWLAAATMAGFPLLAFVEMARDPTSHNLWPMEFAMYGAVSLVAVVGAAITRRLRRRADVGDPPA
jgi:hypothetical protein